MWHELETVGTPVSLPSGEKSLSFLAVMVRGMFAGVKAFKPKKTETAVRHGGGSIMLILWSCFASNSTGMLHKVVE